eukprot:TRINITY_DN23210_c0_g1_i1.p1 TRINITY_DN23210_c0_g1~~TRINITY_DN23210_c0_g1_i1.p1  ORF type:complete len:380 (-),score=79.38 TRINITY_DN23210_c0_g1_i1:220-1317(-)
MAAPAAKRRRTEEEAETPFALGTAELVESDDELPAPSPPPRRVPRGEPRKEEREQERSKPPPPPPMDIGSTVRLSNGVVMPLFGLGSYRAKGRPLTMAVKAAIDLGYRLIDTAGSYKNEDAIREGLKLVPAAKRKDVFLTSKLDYKSHGYDSAIKAYEATIKALGVEKLDLYLIHWPGCTTSNKSSPKHAELRKESWRALEDLYLSGRVRAIGVSNYTVAHLQGLLRHCRVAPQVNQVELHVYLNQSGLVEYCRGNDIAVQSYTTLGRCWAPPVVLYGKRGPDLPKVVDDPAVTRIAEAHGKTPPQVLLRWALQQNIGVIPKSTSPDHVKENASVFGFRLSEREMAELSALDRGIHYVWDPSDIL